MNETKKRSEAIKEELDTVRVFARTGRLPITSSYDDWINPTTKRKVPGVILDFGDTGICELDPKRDADKIKALNDWLADGTDERIVDLSVSIVNNGRLLDPPFPKWDFTTEAKLPEMVESLGLDIERCLRYEAAKDEPRKKLIKALEVMLDAEPVEDELSDPVL